MLRDALEIFEACRQVCDWSGAPYCIENPIGVLASMPHIGKPDHYFDPCLFTRFELGDHYTKRTCLWVGNGFVMPKPSIDLDLADVEPDKRILNMPDSEGRAERRAVMPMGFARAVFHANAPQSARALERA